MPSYGNQEQDELRLHGFHPLRFLFHSLLFDGLINPLHRLHGAPLQGHIGGQDVLVENPVAEPGAVRQGQIPCEPVLHIEQDVPDDQLFLPLLHEILVGHARVQHIDIALPARQDPVPDAMDAAALRDDADFQEFMEMQLGQGKVRIEPLLAGNRILIDGVFPQPLFLSQL